MKHLTLLLSAVVCAACASHAELPAPRTPLTPTARSEVSPPALDKPSNDAAAAPKIASFQLENGLTVYVLERHSFPHVALAYVSLRGGEDAAELETAGLATVIHELIYESIGHESPEDGAAPARPPSAPQTKAPESKPNADEFSSTSFHGDVLGHISYLAALVPAQHLGPAMSSLRDIVTHPALDAATLAQAQKRARRRWNDERYSADGLARNYLMERIYGPTHVLGQHADTAVKRVDTHDLKEVIAGYHARYVPAASALVLVGDVSVEQAKAKVTRRFAAWKEDAPAPETYAPSDWQPRGKRKIFVHNQVRQANIVLGQRAPGVGMPDFVESQVLTQLLGGSFSSRLMGTLRKDQSLTYSVSAELLPRRDGSTLVIDTSVSRDDAKKSLEVILGELRSLQTTPVSEAELERARTALVQRELADYETSEGALARIIQSLELNIAPTTAAQTHIAALAQVTPAQLKAAAQRVFKPKSAPIIIVGDLRFVGDLGRWAQGDDETFGTDP